MTLLSKIGFGSKVSAEMVVCDQPVPNKIILCPKYVGREWLEKAGFLGVAGVVVPSMHWRDFEYFKTQNEFPIMVLLKFGTLEPTADLAEKIAKLDGKNGGLDGDNHELKAN